ncbi:hypothetical protein CJ263_05510 [Maribacter cobaltidurans]|uniref:Uncharacterized protein n=1 Tax=Maribacter cobaltidurans TaxID=1178778 RepID=A0A223V367_9FLAO|nr:hypothetical protein CJ263_05510 [Maribacter cobaltidurans]
MLFTGRAVNFLKNQNLQKLNLKSVIDFGALSGTFLWLGRRRKSGILIKSRKKGFIQDEP